MKRYKPPKYAVFIMCLAVIASSIVIFIHYANKAAIGTVQNGLSSSNAVTKISLQTTIYNNQYVSFNYPKVLQLKKTSLGAGQVLSEYIFNYQSLYPWHLVLTIYNIPNGNLKQNSDYNLRKLSPTRYQETEVNINDITVHIMSDTGSEGFNKVAFLENGSYQAAVALSSDNPDPSQLLKTFNIILNSWQWH